MILNNPELFEEWKADIRTMAGRIIEMRRELYRLLTEELKTPGNWEHIINQIGMFRCVDDLMAMVRVMLTLGLSFTGVSEAQSKALTDGAHVYLTTNGRISMAGLNSKNVRYFAEALDKVVRGV